MSAGVRTRQMRRRKRKQQLMIAYALRAIIITILFLMFTLMVCGVLYIREHLFSPSPTEQEYRGDFSNNSALTDTSIVPVPPQIPGTPKVVLDAGHGGRQPGCVIGDVEEKDVTLSIVLLLQKKLEEAGISVVLTRSGDEHISLEDRSEIANNAGADCFVSIHCNSYEDDSSVNGLECYYYQSSEGQALADAITLSAANRSITTRKVKEENYAVLRETAIPAVLIEVGFLTNSQECQKLLSAEYQGLLVEAIYESILQRIFG